MINRVVFINKLHTASMHGGLSWSACDVPDTYQACLPRHTVILSRIHDHDSIDYCIRIIHPDGHDVDVFHADDFTDNLQEIIHNTYVCAHNYCKGEKEDPIICMLNSFEKIIHSRN